MRIFLKTGPQDHKVFVTPGDKSDCSDFYLPDVSKRQYTVKFVGGEATVPSNLGQYMLDQGLAQKTRFILPENMIIAAAAMEKRITTMRNFGA